MHLPSKYVRPKYFQNLLNDAYEVLHIFTQIRNFCLYIFCEHQELICAGDA